MIWMRRFFNKQNPNKYFFTLEFLILNPNCPNQLWMSLNQVNVNNVRILNPEKRYNKESTGFLIGKGTAPNTKFKYIEK